MEGKTCGTCAHCADRHGPKQPMASHVCMDMGTLIIDPERPNCAGLYYEERTDSVEKIAREWYAWNCEFDLDPVLFTDRLTDIGHYPFE